MSKLIYNLGQNYDSYMQHVIYNLEKNISRHFYPLGQLRFTTNETEPDYYQQKMHVELPNDRRIKIRGIKMLCIEGEYPARNL